MNPDLMEFILEIICLKKVKDRAYGVKFDEYADAGRHCIVLYVADYEIIHFDSFGIKHVPKEIEKFIGHKNIKANIFRIQSNNSIMCGYFFIGFIDFTFTHKTLIDFTSFFSPYDFEKNDKIILSYFKNEWMQFY